MRPSTVSLPWSSIGWFSTEPRGVRCPDGLHGWKAPGTVTNANRRYFQPFQQMLEDAEFTRDLTAIRKLAELGGGLFYPRSEVISVTSDDRRQWGMGGIAHAGHVLLRLTPGERGSSSSSVKLSPREIGDRIVVTLGAGVTSMV